MPKSGMVVWPPAPPRLRAGGRQEEHRPGGHQVDRSRAQGRGVATGGNVVPERTGYAIEQALRRTAQPAGFGARACASAASAQQPGGVQVGSQRSMRSSTACTTSTGESALAVGLEQVWAGRSCRAAAGFCIGGFLPGIGPAAAPTANYPTGAGGSGSRRIMAPWGRGRCIAGVHGAAILRSVQWP